MRKACKLMAFLVWPCASLAQASPPKPYVFDSTGKVIGPYFSDTVILKVVSTNDVVQIGFQPAGFGFSFGVRFPHYFKASDCTGKYYAAAPDGVVNVGFVDPLRTKYIDYVDADNTVKVEINSYSGGDQTCQAYHYVGLVHPIKSVLIDALGFTPPFSVKWHR